VETYILDRLDIMFICACTAFDLFRIKFPSRLSYSDRLKGYKLGGE
jgi:hypothetical protein